MVELSKSSYMSYNWNFFNQVFCVIRDCLNWISFLTEKTLSYQDNCVFNKFSIDFVDV